jgi:hypothetical protein
MKSIIQRLTATSESLHHMSSVSFQQIALCIIAISIWQYDGVDDIQYIGRTVRHRLLICIKVAADHPR